MNISYYQKYEPIFNAWYIKRMLGQGSFGQVYEIERRDMGSVYKAALKVVTIPQHEGEVRSLIADGMTMEDVSTYYESVVQEIVNEFVLLSKLKGNSNIVSYEDHMVIPHEDGIGYDVLIRMELLTPLQNYIESHAVSKKDVIKFGIDMCKALEICQKHNIIHRDVKAENIFVSENGDFKLGDFGIAKMVEKTVSNMSRKGTYTYMAPEIYKGEMYGSSADIYSLGIVLYRLLNNNRAPFLPEYPKQIAYSDKEAALMKRISGEKMEYPANAKDRLGEIVLKACAYQPKDRYSLAYDMRSDLEELYYEAKRRSTTSKTLKRPVESEDIETEEKKAELSEKPSGISKQKLIIALAIVAVIVIGAIFFFVGNNNKIEEVQPVTTQESATSETTEQPVDKSLIGQGLTDESEIKSAIENASEGETILIEAGDYHFGECIHVYASDVVIKGTDPSNSAQFNCGIHIHGFNVSVSNIDINIEEPSYAIDGAIGIKVEAAGTTVLKNVDVEMLYYTEHIIYAVMLYSDAELENCVINVDDDNGNGNVAIGTNSEFTLKDCNIKSNDVGICGFIGLESTTDSNVKKMLEENTFDAPTRIVSSSSY